MGQPAEQGVSSGKGALGSCLKAGGRARGGKTEENRVISAPSEDRAPICWTVLP